MRARSQLAAMPLIHRFASVGFARAFLLGGLVGLLLGLLAYPPTAWFAVLEVGLPAGVLGAAFGALTGMITGTLRGSTTADQAPPRVGAASPR